MKDFWDKRYTDSRYRYGVHPNVFFSEQIEILKPGRVLLPAEGEGRNAVFAASKGWEVFAFDQSKEAKNKALGLATKNKVDIKYNVFDISEASYESGEFDLIALIYVHLPQNKRRSIHELMTKFLRPGGYLILEGFNRPPGNNSPEAGGPKDPEMLFAIEEIEKDFESLNTEYIAVEEVTLHEGDLHKGKASVLRFVGRKT